MALFHLGVCQQLCAEPLFLRSFNQFFWLELFNLWSMGLRNFTAQEDGLNTVSKLSVVDLDVFRKPKCLGNARFAILDTDEWHCPRPYWRPLSMPFSV